MSFTSHNAYLVSNIAAFRQQKLLARQRKLAERENVAGRVDRLLDELQLHFLKDSDLVRVYVNQTQVNVDFLTGTPDKLYLTCSRRHDKVRVDLVVRNLLPTHNKTVFAWFDLKYGLKAKDASGKRQKDTMMRFMMDPKDLTKFIETVINEFRPKYNDRPACFEEPQCD